MTSRIGCAIALGLLAASSPALAIPPPPPQSPPPGVPTYTLERLYTAPAAELAAQMLAPLAERMVEYRAGEGRFYGRPRGGVRDLCEVETISVKFDGNEAEGLFVTDLAIETLYRRAQSPPAPPVFGVPQDHEPCSLNGTAWFEAPWGWPAAQALSVLDQLAADAALIAPAPYSMTCINQYKQVCDVRKATQATLGAEVRRVEAFDCKAPDRRCFTIALGGAGPALAVRLHQYSMPRPPGWQAPPGRDPEALIESIEFTVFDPGARMPSTR